MPEYFVPPDVVVCTCIRVCARTAKGGKQKALSQMHAAVENRARRCCTQKACMCTRSKVGVGSIGRTFATSRGEHSAVESTPEHVPATAFASHSSSGRLPVLLIFFSSKRWLASLGHTQSRHRATPSHGLLSSSSTPSACSALFFIQDLNRARRRSHGARRAAAARQPRAARAAARSSRTAAGATSTSGIRAGPAPLPRALPEGARAVALSRGLGCGL